MNSARNMRIHVANAAQVGVEVIPVLRLLELYTFKDPTAFNPRSNVLVFDDCAGGEALVLVADDESDFAAFANRIVAGRRYHWSNHPDFPRCNWQRDVGNGATILGYWDWVATQWARTGTTSVGAADR